MNKLDELIKELCPNGVEYKELGELGIFENIGVDKKINVNEKEILLLNYTDIYKNNYIDSSIPKMIVTANDKKIENCSVEECDIFITPTSETKEDIGHASVILETIPNCCYSYHIMRYRLINPNRVTASFIMYLFYSQDLKRQILKYAQGLTRYGLSKEKFSNLLIPFPNIRIQEEIVKVLDDYTKSVEELKGKLNEELTARKKQYSWYRDYLLKFENKVEMVKLGSISELKSGGTPKTGVLEYWKNGNISWMSSGEVNKGNIYETEKKITKEGYENSNTKMLPKNTVVIALAGQGKTRGTVAITRIELCTNQSLCGIIPNKKLNSEYLYHYLKTQYENLRQLSSGDDTRGGLNLKMLANYLIPLPPLEVQKRIVEVLDNFEKICNDLNIRLPAEIEARQKQYEFYRNFLLTFKIENCTLPKTRQDKTRQDIIKLFMYIFGYIELELGEIFELKNGYTPSKSNPEYWLNGNINWFKIEDINTNGRILKNSIEKVNKKGIKGKLFPENTLIISTSATIGEYALITKEFLCNQRFTCLIVKGEYKNILLPMFLKHYAYILSKKCKENIKIGNFPSVDMDKFKKFLIPLPLLEEQQRIVNILDRFDKLCNDISEGLPAEIEARQKQYEYYREKLLTFKNIND